MEANSLQTNNQKRLKILLCGYGHLGLALLQGLLGCADLCEVAGVFRWASRPECAKYWEPIEETFQQMVQSAGLRDIVCPGMNAYEFTNLLEEMKPDIVLVGAWGEILKSHLLDRTDMLFVNCHPSKLPEHRGANPYASVVRMGESETGVTFHRMVRGIDAGTILMQSFVPLTEHETGETVREKCSVAAFGMVRTLISNLYQAHFEGATLQEVEQDHTQKSYYPALKPEEGLIAWEMSAVNLYRHSRALYPWLLTYSHLEGRQMVLFYSPRFIPRPDHLKNSSQVAGTILEFRQDAIVIALSDVEWVLEIPQYQLTSHHKALPKWLSQLLAPWLLRSGKRFRNPV